MTAVLGRGGQGTVYLGRGSSPEQVAIKVLHAGAAADENARRRFLREAEAARQVAPFCTARVLDTGLVGDQPYIVSEHIPGPSLDRLVRTEGPRSGSGLERLAVATLTALAAIHRAGIIHRDFKPHNVIMGPEGPVVIDFGIARVTDQTATHSVMGTPVYMAPEQFGGAPITPAADLFSWASSMVYAATGQQAFRGDTFPVIMHAILTREPDLSAVPRQLRPALTACLAKDPAARPSAAALLRRLTGDEPPAAHPTAGMPESERLTLRPHPQTPPGPPPGWGEPPPPPAGGGGRSKKIGLAVGAGAVALVLVVVGVRAVVRNAVQGALSSDPAATSQPSTSSAASSEPTPSPSASEEPDEEPTEQPTEDPFNPADLDKESTDPTPITADALLPVSFKSPQGVRFSREAAGVEDCPSPWPDERVKSALRKARCGDMAVGAYIGSGAPKGRIMVTVWVVPLKDAARARTAYSRLKNVYVQDWGIRCPQEGPGSSGICYTSNWWDVQLYSWTGQRGRYVIRTLAVYTNLTRASSATTWLKDASRAAFLESGPMVYQDGQ
ncbi:serine/threonine-protein kinase [Nonomuraea soli]|uniref:Serine/threonine protein kinase n=1 Tax=Nonomuraea soli TaxID=1032476 RepID=A0A7W0CCW0_9ACTN|nr:serine/threonine-protein kinase [Nonomuraea soli]MBA2888822.1 serine/threonine protein kinase [Nonomuraea soli]